MTMSGRQALTVLLPVRAGRESALELALASAAPVLAERLRGAETLHFARLVLVPGVVAGGRAAPPYLLLETTYDGDLPAHAAELFALAGAEVAAVLAECEGASARSASELEATLRRGARRPAIFAATGLDLGVKQIRRDAALRESVSELLERERASLAGLRPLEILRSVREHLGFSSTSAEAVVRRELAEREELLPRLFGIVPLVFRMLVADTRDWLLGLWHDRAEPAWAPATGVLPSTLRAPQRAFTHLSLVKPGRFRRGALRRALAFTGSVLAACGVEHASSGVHAFRFVLLDDGRFLFTDQHDGSLVSRLSALGGGARALLALVWSSTEGFPRALFRHLLGKTDTERLLEWLRARELGPGFWYSAYPTLTARDVARNAELRELITAEPTDERARRLLELV